MLQINRETLSKSGNSIFAVIYFEYGDFIFPDRNWNDFVVVILEWWCSGMYKLLSNQSISEDLLFMDGPFTLKIKYLEDGYFQLYFIEQDKNVLHIDKVQIDQFMIDFLKSTNELIRETRKLSLDNEDTRKLEQGYSNLQKVFTNYQMKLH